MAGFDRPRAILLVWAWIGIGASLIHCSGEPAEEMALETVDVGPGLEIAIDDDPQAVARAPELTGVLPGDFPPDLPLYLPASIVDLDQSNGLRTIALLTPRSLQQTEREFTALLQQHGWRTINHEGNKKTLQLGKQKIFISLKDARPGTLYEIGYIP